MYQLNRLLSKNIHSKFLNDELFLSSLLYCWKWNGFVFSVVVQTKLIFWGCHLGSLKLVRRGFCHFLETQLIDLLGRKNNYENKCCSSISSFQNTHLIRAWGDVFTFLLCLTNTPEQPNISKLPWHKTGEKKNPHGFSRSIFHWFAQLISGQSNLLLGDVDVCACTVCNAHAQCAGCYMGTFDCLQGCERQSAAKSQHGGDCLLGRIKPSVLLTFSVIIRQVRHIGGGQQWQMPSNVKVKVDRLAGGDEMWYIGIHLKQSWMWLYAV